MFSWLKMGFGVGFGLCFGYVLGERAGEAVCDFIEKKTAAKNASVDF